MQRLGRNHGRYQGETVDIRAVMREIDTAGQGAGWAREIFHSADGFQWLAFRGPRPPGDSRPRFRVYISTGIHGDEPAGPLAALRLMRENVWPSHCEIALCPCLNPPGFARNQRENGRGIDLNRDYLHLHSPEIRAHVAWLERQSSFDFSLCLHEDWESHGFYVYELNPDDKPSLAEAMIASVAGVCPIDRSEVIEGRPAKNGIIRPNLDPRSRPQWPEAFWLLTHKTRLSYTLEAPSDFPLPTRVNSLVAGVHAALAQLPRPE